MIHLGLQSIDLLKLRSTIRQEGVWMFLDVSGPWLSAWLFTSADGRFRCSTVSGMWRTCACLAAVVALTGCGETVTENEQAEPTVTLVQAEVPEVPVETVPPKVDQIGFVSNVDGDSEIFVMDPGGANVRQLTDNEYHDDDPAWSPSREEIVFVSNRDQYRGGEYPESKTDVFLMDSDGFNVRQLTFDDFVASEPTWSPSGQKIAYVSKRDGDFEIYVMNPDGSDVQQLTSDEFNNFSPCWSSDGSEILFASTRTGDVDFFVMDADGSNVRQLTGGPLGYSPEWSPAGDQIAFTSPPLDIRVWELSSQSFQNLTNDPGRDFMGSWSPDGARIAFLSDRYIADGRLEVFVMDADGANVVNTTHEATFVTFLP